MTLPPTLCISQFPSLRKPLALVSWYSLEMMHLQGLRSQCLCTARKAKNKDTALAPISQAIKGPTVYLSLWQPASHKIGYRRTDHTENTLILLWGFWEIQRSLLEDTWKYVQYLQEVVRGEGSTWKILWQRVLFQSKISRTLSSL